MAPVNDDRRRPVPIDPTANVLQLVEAAIKRVDDIANLEREHRREISSLETKYRDAQLVAEARRLDALLAAQNTAVAIAATRAEGTASALADRVDTAAKTLATEAGSKEQRTEGRQSNQWAIGLVMALPSAFLALIGLVLLLSK